MIKRDFLFEQKIIFIISLFIQVFFLLLNLVIPEMTGHAYQMIYFITLIFILSYPVMLFKQISPRIGDYFNANPITAQLPFSKKHLMWLGMKPWIVIAPFYLLGITAMMAYFRTQSFNTQFFDLLMGGGQLIFLAITVVGGFVLQLLISQIFYLKYREPWFTIAITLILFNLIYVAISGMIGYSLQLYSNQIGWLMSLLYFLINLALFLFNFDLIEEIYQ